MTSLNHFYFSLYLSNVTEQRNKSYSDDLPPRFNLIVRNTFVPSKILWSGYMRMKEKGQF